jgi:hypothetical protein
MWKNSAFDEIGGAPKLTLGLRSHVHFSVGGAACDVEASVLRLAYAAENALVHDGRNVQVKVCHKRRLNRE